MCGKQGSGVARAALTAGKPGGTGYRDTTLAARPRAPATDTQESKNHIFQYIKQRRYRGEDRYSKKNYETDLTDPSHGPQTEGMKEKATMRQLEGMCTMLHI